MEQSKKAIKLKKGKKNIVHNIKMSKQTAPQAAGHVSLIFQHLHVNNDPRKESRRRKRELPKPLDPNDKVTTNVFF